MIRQTRTTRASKREHHGRKNQAQLYARLNVHPCIIGQTERVRHDQLDTPSSFIVCALLK